MSIDAGNQPTVDIDWLDADQVAAELSMLPKQVSQLVQERRLIGVRRNGVWYVPAAFVADGAVVKGLPGTIVLLGDAGYSPAEAIDWLFADDDTLPGSPIQALRDNRGKEVHRRAQAAGF